MRLLIVEDSEPLSEALNRSLNVEGYACDIAADGLSALQYINSYSYDLIILDLMLPHLDGFEVLRELSLQNNMTPVLVLSAYDQLEERIRALDFGADDYLIKPFELDELFARLRALMRRPAKQYNPVLRHGELEVDPRTCTAHLAGKNLQLTPKEYGLLALLLRHQGRILSRTQIFEHLYNSSSDTSDKIVEVIVSTLRTKLAQQGLNQLILTRRGFGYILP